MSPDRHAAADRHGGLWQPVWAGVPDTFDLPPNALHLWRLRADTPWVDAGFAGDLPDAHSLSPEEQQRAARYKFPQPRARFVTARAGLRWLLGRYLGIAPAAVRLAFGAQDKPYLAEPDQRWLSFNLAHAGDLILYAVANGRDVGIDVERLDTTGPDTWRALRRYLSPREQEALALCKPGAAGALALGLWTCKEAYGKARGMGLSAGPYVAPPVQIADPAPGGAGGCRAVTLPGCWTHHDAGRAWTFRRFAPVASAIAAVVVDAGAAPDESSVNTGELVVCCYDPSVATTFPLS